MEAKDKIVSNEVSDKETKEAQGKKEKKEHKNKNDEKIIELTEALAKEKEHAMRIQAEMMNFKKRKEDEVANVYKYANEDILRKLLPIIDNFERALSLENDDNKEFLKGFKMINDSLKNILQENSVVEIDALNKPFDPNVHQAVLTEHVDGVESNTVIAVLQKGYMYKDRVLRVAMVKVSE